MSLLSTESLVKEYHHRRVVNGVSIAVNPGEIVGLLGPNGAGKTTTFIMVVGVVRPDGGAVKFEDAEITRMPMHERARLGVGYLTQEPSVFRKLTVEQNILAILETCRLTAQERQVRLKYLLEELDLARLAKSKAYQLSGGEKRRLEITRSLVISRLKERGLGILITDHSVREMLKLIDRGYIIVKGEVACQGTAEFLANDPKAREIYLGPDFNM